MPRPRKTEATTQSKIIERRASGKAARLKFLLRRAGFIGGGVVLVCWAAAWLFLSGAFTRGVQWTEDKIYRETADRGFVINNVLVEGRVNTDPDMLRALLDVNRGDPVFAFNPREAKDLIERLTWIKEAHVERRLPDTVYIGLRERVPLALWQDKGKIRLVDNEGVTLTDKNLGKFGDLLIIVGDDAPLHAPELVNMLGAEPDIRGRIEAATWVGERRWDLKLKNGMTVKLPESDLGLALARLSQAQDKDGLLDRDVTVIDVRESDRITVRTKPGAVEEYKGGKDI
jgi:cell division protein FtsQ